MTSKFTNEMLEKMSFNSELHLKKINTQQEKRTNDYLEDFVSPKSKEARKDKTEGQESRVVPTKKDANVKWSRRFKNPDLSTCWLNSCLQLILSGLDHLQEEIEFESELGLMLYNLKKLDPKTAIDPTDIKNTIIFAEDMRIARRKSEITNQIQDKNELAKRLDNIDRMYLNLKTGQQCGRDFFICLSENLETWIDVYKMFSFTTINLTICLACGHQNSFEQSQIYLEMDVPSDGTNLCESVEKMFHDGTIVDYNCEDGCKTKFQAKKKSVLKSAKETQFIIIMLRRSVISENGVEIVFNKVNSEGNISIRYKKINYYKTFYHTNFRDQDGSGSIYQPVAVISHQGQMTTDREGQGHYTCDVKTKDGHWFKTNDNKVPIPISKRNLSKDCAIVLYSKINGQ